MISSRRGRGADGYPGLSPPGRYERRERARAARFFFSLLCGAPGRLAVRKSGNEGFCLGCDKSVTVKIRHSN